MPNWQNKDFFIAIEKDNNNIDIVYHSDSDPDDDPL